MWVYGSGRPSSAVSLRGSAPTGPTCPLPALLLDPNWASAGSLLRPAPAEEVVLGVVGVAEEVAAGQRVSIVAGTGEVGAGVLTEGCCLRGMEAVAEEAGGDDAEVGVLSRGEEAEEERLELRGGTGAAEEPRPGIWREEVEEERHGRPGTEEEEAAAVLYCGEEEGEAEEGHRETEEEAALASGARSSQPRRLLSSR